jgi:hypothetical protein
MIVDESQPLSHNFYKLELIKREKLNNNSNKYEINEYLSNLQIQKP